ncbi:hypothetical protein ACIGHG_08795 [Bacillus sp. NPDC077411]|uniref:hypothetical protein n=1 Tax=unclassified Bacillus (in: firmicutes) TaxID=185979 RepID=UPI001587769D|nr:hypothetical protein [Bacillus sp. 71mf]
MHILQRGDFIVKVKYGERGTFDPVKAAKGLIELYNKFNNPNVLDNQENDKIKDKPN